MKTLLERLLWPWALVLILAFAVFPNAQTTIANNAADLAGHIVMVADSTVARTVTNLFTFSRGTSAPFAVVAGAAKVANLNADQIDGYEGINLIDIGNCQFRLSLTTAVPVTTADVTAATTVYVEPIGGYQCAVYDGSASWLARTSTELSFSIAGFAASTIFDVWLYDNAGTLTTETLAWASDTARATALTTQNGVLVKSGATTRRYLGSFRTTTTIGQTEDSFAKRYVWSYYNRRRRGLRVAETTASWTYTTATYRQANASTANQIAAVIGFADSAVDVEVIASAANTAANVTVAAAIGDNSTTTVVTGMLGGTFFTQVVNQTMNSRASLRYFPAVGLHNWVWLEYSAAAGTTTWYGTTTLSGIQGTIDG